jgi:RNA polymerase sigma-70 factor (ECF subfamily)
MTHLKDPISPAPSTSANNGFDEVVLPHLDAAYRLARWLVGNEHDAEDIVQEASLRALRYFRTFNGGNGRAWFLKIVRNTTWGWRHRAVQALTDPFDEEQHSSRRPTADPETLLLHTDDVALIERTLRNLPHRFRELLVLRDLEDLSYRELADVLEVPIGTIMSGLSRARQAFRVAVNKELMRPGMSTKPDPHVQETDEMFV